MIQNYEERIEINKERIRLAEIATRQANKKIAELVVELDRLNKQLDAQRKRSEHYSQQAEEQRQRHSILDARLRELGIDPDS